MEFDVVQGDIAAQSADVLVNAAGTSLQMGSGVAGALRRGAGRAINEEAVSKGPVELGGVAVTDAYDLLVPADTDGFVGLFEPLDIAPGQRDVERGDGLF